MHLTVGAVIVRNGKVLMVLHTKLNRWLFPGGHIDKNETPDQAIIREVKEETGLTFKPGEYGHVEETQDVIERLAVPLHVNTHSVGDHDHCCLYYLGSAGRSKMKMSNESKALRWVGRNELGSIGVMPSHVRRIATC